MVVSRLPETREGHQISRRIPSALFIAWNWNMSRIRGTDTKSEKALRSALHKAGFRFRLHDRRLPGNPDIVLKKFNSVIFVHGCFWHRHKDCDKAATPKSNTDFWEEKFKKNIERDEQNSRELFEEGWEVLTVWECEIESNLRLVSM